VIRTDFDYRESILRQFPGTFSAPARYAGQRRRSSMARLPTDDVPEPGNLDHRHRS
jgi:hypothetical protein